MEKRRGQASATGLIAGSLWGATLFVAFAATDAFAPPTLSYRLLLAFLCALVAAAHAGTLGLGATALTTLTKSPRGASLSLAAVHLVAGCTYALLALAVAKLILTQSHLGIEDVRFVATNLPQLLGESTRVERRLLLFAVLLLPATVALLAVGSRRVSRAAQHLGPRELAVLAVAGWAGLGVASWRAPSARWITTGLFPDTRAMARWLTPLPRPPVSERAAWQSDPTRLSPREPYRPPAGFARWNVLVVMLESASWARTFGPQARLESTPTLAQLAAESVVFDRAWATATHSDYAQTSILASLHPRKYDDHDYFVDLDYPRTLPWDVLVPLGYRSAVFSCQNESWGNMRSFLQTPALQLLRHAPDWPAAPRRGDAISKQIHHDPLDAAFRGAAKETKVFERTVAEAFIEWVDEEPAQPFVAYLNFQATHFPYVPEPSFRGPYAPTTIDFPASFLGYPPAEVDVLLNRWHNALAYVDQELGRLLAALATRGLEGNTALLLVADHGEAFYEGGFPTHGTSLREEQLRSAMLLRYPGVAPRRVAESVSVLDGLPTLFAAMGLPRHGNWQGRDDVLDPGYTAAGRPLLATIQGLTREDAVVRGDVQYVHNWDRQQATVYDLTRPPREQVDVGAMVPAARAELRALLLREIDVQLSYYTTHGWRDGYYPPRLP